MPVDERVAYAALALTPGLSVSRLHALYQVFGSWSGAMSAPFAFLRTVPGLSRAAATAVCGASREAADRALSQAERLGARVLLPGETELHH